VPIVIILVALTILGGIVVVAMGRGGELARDVPEPSMADFRSGAEVAQYRPPPALLGYDPGATEFALLQAGRALADRDAEIAWLRGRLSELQPEGHRTDGAVGGLPGQAQVAADDDERPSGGPAGQTWPASETSPASGGEDL
jgi:hypothetical protein